MRGEVADRVGEAEESGDQDRPSRGSGGSQRGSWSQSSVGTESIRNQAPAKTKKGATGSGLPFDAT